MAAMFDAQTACPLFEFPPFFTLQTADATRAKQLEEWRQLIISWSATTKVSTLQLSSWPLWENPRISRKWRRGTQCADSARGLTRPPSRAGRLSPDGVSAVAEYCVSRGSAEWLDAAHGGLRIFYRSPSDWAGLLYAHHQQMGFGAGLVTLYELHSGAGGRGMAWEGLESVTLMRALELLEKGGKVALHRAQDLDETALRFL